MRHLRRATFVLAIFACVLSAARGAAQASSTDAAAQASDGAAPPPRKAADASNPTATASHDAQPQQVAALATRYKRLRISGITLLAAYGAATVIGASAAYAADRGCTSHDDFCIHFGYGVYFATVGAMASPLLIAGATTLGIGKRRQRALQRQYPTLALGKHGANLVWAMSF